ncbi:unnamed protein product, partial [Symbiodinium necroappetens]
MKLFYLSGREVWQRVEHPWLHWKSVEYKAGWTSSKGASLEEKQARKEAKQEAKRRKKEKENTKKKEAAATKLAELRHNDTARKREYRRKAREALRGELDVLYKRAELDYAAAALEEDGICEVLSTVPCTCPALEADGKVSTDEVGSLKHRASEWGDIAARAEETVGIHKARRR